MEVRYQLEWVCYENICIYMYMVDTFSNRVLPLGFGNRVNFRCNDTFPNEWYLSEQLPSYPLPICKTLYLHHFPRRLYGLHLVSTYSDPHVGQSRCKYMVRFLDSSEIGF